MDHIFFSFLKLAITAGCKPGVKAWEHKYFRRASAPSALPNKHWRQSRFDDSQIFFLAAAILLLFSIFLLVTAYVWV